MSLVPLENFTLPTDPETLANATLNDFTATRDGSDLNGSSLFSYKESSPGSEWYGSATRRGHLRTFTPLVFGIVESQVQSGEAFIIRLTCPDNASCKTKGTYAKQIKVLREILTAESTEELVVLSSWFKHGRHFPQDVDYSFYVELTDVDDEWELATNSFVGEVLGMWVTLHRRDSDVDTTFGSEYFLRSSFFAVTESHVDSNSQAYVCDNDDGHCRFCGKSNNE